MNFILNFIYNVDKFSWRQLTTLNASKENNCTTISAQKFPLSWAFPYWPCLPGRLIEWICNAYLFGRWWFFSGVPAMAPVKGENKIEWKCHLKFHVGNSFPVCQRWLQYTENESRGNTILKIWERNKKICIIKRWRKKMIIFNWVINGSKVNLKRSSIFSSIITRLLLLNFKSGKVIYFMNFAKRIFFFIKA